MRTLRSTLALALMALSVAACDDDDDSAALPDQGVPRDSTVDSTPTDAAADAITADSAPLDPDAAPLDPDATAEDGAPLDPDAESADAGLPDAQTDAALPGKVGEPARPNAATVPLSNDLRSGNLIDALSPSGFTGHLLPARAGARLTVAAQSPDRGLDLTLHLFGPLSGGQIDPDRLLLVADDEQGLDPVLSFTAPVDGHYLVVVGSFDGLASGEYSLDLTCDGEACAWPGLASSACPDAVINDATACMADLLEGSTDLGDLLTAAELCTEAESLGDAFDAACTDERRALFCGMDFGTFWSDVRDPCQWAVYAQYAAKVCVFGATYRDLFESPNLTVTSHRRLVSLEGLSAAELSQLVAAVKVAYEEVNNGEQALAAVDGGEVNQVRLSDPGLTQYVAYEYGAGDNSYGALFVGDTVTLAAQIQDGDLYECQAPLTAGQRCTDDSECQGGDRCLGRFEGVGRCGAQVVSPHDGETCLDASTCGGLVCANLNAGGDGQCILPWMAGRFDQAPILSIPDEGVVEAELDVYGLATVPIDVNLRATIHHPDVRALRVTLLNPMGTEAVVYEGTSDGEALTLDLPVLGIPGDESVNGRWRLRVEDTTAGGLGWIESFGLSLTSRWD